MILALSVATNVSAYGQDRTLTYVPLANHEIVVDAHDWESFPIHCHMGDTLSGEFIVKHDGELYPGDQTEYDLSLLTGIDFLILDEANYDLWIQDESATPIFEMKTLVQLTWSIEVPHEGFWYIVYVNDSIYIKQIEGSILHPGSGDVLLFVFGIIGLVTIVGIAYMFWIKRGRAVAT
jgi:hypothetical protein